MSLYILLKNKKQKQKKGLLNKQVTQTWYFSALSPKKLLNET